MWSLFCPDEAPGLADVWGPEFESLYEQYETEGKARRSFPAQELWFAIISSQVETGTPYMLFKGTSLYIKYFILYCDYVDIIMTILDACNSKSNQQNLGTIKSSNLCTEIVEYTSPDEVAVCNLASVNLGAFVDESNRTYDFTRLYQVTKVVAKNLNKVIDINFYPVVEARNSNMRNRPIGIGVQGLADAFAKMKYAFESAEAMELNKEIFETIYFAAMEASCELAEIHGPYSTYEGSPVSKGILQPDMWGVTPTARWDWEGLRAKIAQFGIRNSLLLAPMPTATTAQVGDDKLFYKLMAICIL